MRKAGVAVAEIKSKVFLDRLSYAWKEFLRDPAANIVIILLTLQCVCIVAGMIFPDDFRYLSSLNMKTLLRSIPQIGFIAIGVGILMIAGEFDLSVGATFTISGLMLAMLHNAGMPVVVCVMLALSLGVAIGLVNGMLTLSFAIPSFIITLGTMMILRGVILFVSGTATIPFRPAQWFDSLVTGEIGFLQAQFLWLLFFVVAAWVLLKRHRIGNHLYAVGGNRKAANAIGVNVMRTKLFAFATAGFMAAISGIVSTTRVNSVSPIQGQGLELQAIAACVIGGLALTGGRGSAIGIFAGAALIYTVQNVLLLVGAPGYYLDAFIGLVLVVAVIANGLMNRRA
jgi:simple sugar transport system permease protein